MKTLEWNPSSIASCREQGMELKPAPYQNLKQWEGGQRDAADQPKGDSLSADVAGGGALSARKSGHRRRKDIVTKKSALPI
jgi:hypothetical protein